MLDRANVDRDRVRADQDRLAVDVHRSAAHPQPQHLGAQQEEGPHARWTLETDDGGTEQAVQHIFAPRDLHEQLRRGPDHYGRLRWQGSVTRLRGRGAPRPTFPRGPAVAVAAAMRERDEQWLPAAFPGR